MKIIGNQGDVDGSQFPQIFDMAAKMEELVVEVHEDIRGHEDPPHAGQSNQKKQKGRRQRHKHECDQGVRREKHDAKVTQAVDRRLVIRKKLVMGQRMAGVYRHEEISKSLDRTMHHVAVDPPFEQIGHENDHRDDQPFVPSRIHGLPH